MAVLDDITLGRYVAGESILHRLDPRLKLCGLPLMVIAAFSAAGFERLSAMLLLAATLALLSRIGWRIWWRGVWVLRYLFLFTLLLHLFFSPGRTLFGLELLSLDGLILGAGTCLRLALAILFSSMLTLTTSSAELAAAFASLAGPLRRFGLRVEEASMLLMLVLHFIPVLREEGKAQFEKAEGGVAGGRSLVERARLLRRIAAPLLLALADRADLLARALCRGERVLGDSVELAPFRPMALGNLLPLLLGVFLFSVIFGVLR